MANGEGSAKKFTLFKNSPFAAPAWPEPQEGAAENSDDEFFSRSKHTYAVLAAGEQDKKKRKRREHRETETNVKSPTPPSQKKRRASPDPDTKSAGPPQSQRLPSTTHSRVPSIEALAGPSTQSSNKPSGDSKGQTKFAPQSAPAPVFDVESDNDEQVVITSAASLLPSSPSIQPPPPPTHPSVASNDAPPAPSDNVQSLTPTKTQPTNEPQWSLTEPASPCGVQRVRQPSKPAMAPASNTDEPKVGILITSRIPGTTPLIVRRQLGQRLKEVRLEWCHRQPLLRAEDIPGIVLTWRGRRVYDSTSCRALGIGTDADGNLVGDGEKDLFGIEDRRIHMEAMTEEILLQTKEARLRSNAHAAEEKKKEPEESEDRTVTQAPPEERVRLILRSSGWEDLKLMGKPVCLYCHNMWHDRVNAVAVVPHIKALARVPPEEERG